MLFNKSTVMFYINSVPVIGNFNSGGIIGLTEQGRLFCEEIMKNGVEISEVKTENRELFEALVGAGCFKDSVEKDVLSAYLHVTQRCNLHCIGCYSLDKDRNALKDPSEEDVKRAVLQLSKHGCKMLVISGGEPFLRKDLSHLLKYAKKEACIEKIQIITNGTFATDKALEDVRPYVDGIAISIDGYSSGKATFLRDDGIFDKVISAVKRCKEAGIQTSILPTVHARNYDCLKEYVVLSKELEVGISFSLLTCSPKDAVLKDWLPTGEQLSNIARQLIELGTEGTVSVNDMPIGDGIDARRSCEVGCKILSISADGTVYPCHMLHDSRLAMGNIFKEELTEILSSDIAKTCEELHVDHFDVCNKCTYRYICGGGCRARSFYSYGNLTSQDTYCPMMQTYFEWISDQIETKYRL